MLTKRICTIFEKNDKTFCNIFVRNTTSEVSENVKDLSRSGLISKSAYKQFGAENEKIRT